jgi:hypothetical protein
MFYIFVFFCLFPDLKNLRQTIMVMVKILVLIGINSENKILSVSKTESYNENASFH